MYIRRGNTRIVFVFPKLGFVIKFPIIHLWPIRKIIRYLSRRNWDNIKRWVGQWKISVDCSCSLKVPVIGGIVANWHERKVWEQTHHILLIPTWFSLFGLMNIQKYGEPLKINGIWIAVNIDKLTNRASEQCGHGFEIAGNYCEVNGCLRLIDYGGRRLWPVILEHGEKIAKVTVAECMKDPFEEKK